MNSFNFSYKEQRLRELVNFRISPSMKERLETEKKKRGLDLSNTIRTLLEEVTEK